MLKNWIIAILFGLFVVSLVFGIGEKLNSDSWKEYALDDNRFHKDIMALDLCRLQQTEE